NLASFLFEFTIPSLNSGFYTISPAIASGSQDNHIQHNWIHDALIFQVMNKQKFELQGLLTLEDVKFYHLNQGA
ncbi:MAG: Wzt carbohydrate-binding domain-containing protein, partial [Desulfitobacteriaceae bacterium]